MSHQHTLAERPISWQAETALVNLENNGCSFNIFESADSSSGSSTA